MHVQKMFVFEAAHYIPGHETCGEIHGHTYTLTIKLEGPIHPNSGMVIDFKRLSSIASQVLKKLDHNLLNNMIPNPTAELLVQHILKELTIIFNSFSHNLTSLTVYLQEGNGGIAIDKRYFGDANENIPA